MLDDEKIPNRLKWAIKYPTKYLKQFLKEGRNYFLKELDFLPVHFWKRKDTKILQAIIEEKENGTFMLEGKKWTAEEWEKFDKENIENLKGVYYQECAIEVIHYGSPDSPNQENRLCHKCLSYGHFYYDCVESVSAD